MTYIKPIETYYNGNRFRSRLEARWAVFFDTLGVNYEYEPEGFDVGGGMYYLPDFRVKCWGMRGHKRDKPFDLWIEVKGVMTEKDKEKIQRFTGEWEYDHSDKVKTEYFEPENRILIVGNIPPHGVCHDSYEMGAYDEMDGVEIYPFNYENIDGDYFGAYPAADKNGHFYLFGDDSNYINKEDIPRILRAYDKARQARFEHGENPRR